MQGSPYYFWCQVLIYQNCKIQAISLYFAQFLRLKHTLQIVFEDLSLTPVLMLLLPHFTR